MMAAGISARQTWVKVRIARQTMLLRFEVYIYDAVWGGEGEEEISIVGVHAPDAACWFKSKFLRMTV